MKSTGYQTKQRAIIEEYLRKNGDKHYTVDTLCELLSRSGNTVGRTTVYRFLERLSGEGRVRKYINSAGESVCYQYVVDSVECSEHFHLKCEKCGRLIHMDCEHLTHLKKHINTEHGFNINPLKTIFYGVCEGCSDI